MPKMYAVQGAMAVRRQREKREIRRLSQLNKHLKQSSQKSPSQGDLSQPHRSAAPKSETSQTAFYLGVVFILLGFLMIFSSIIVSDDNTDLSDLSSLLGAGVTFLIIGLIMVMVNRIISAKEEEELTKYVSTRLARSRSGNALVRDCESGDDLSSHLTKARALRAQKNKKPAGNCCSHCGRAYTKSGGGSKSSSMHSHLSTMEDNQCGCKTNAKSHLKRSSTSDSAKAAASCTVNPMEALDTLTESGPDAAACSADMAFYTEVISETETLLSKKHIHQASSS